MKYTTLLLFVFLSGITFSQVLEIAIDFNEDYVDAVNRFNSESIEYDGSLIFPLTNAEFGEELAIIKMVLLKLKWMATER